MTERATVVARSGWGAIWRVGFLLLAAAGFWLLLSWSNPRILDVVVHTGGAGRSVTLRGQPYVIGASARRGAKVTVQLEYRPGQNATLYADPLQECLPRRFRVNGRRAGFDRIETNRACSYAVIDLSPYLQPGLNRLRFHMPRNPRESAFYLGPVLLGTHFPSTLAGLGLSAVAAAALLLVMRRLGFPLPSCLLMMGGLCYFQFWLHHQPNLTYTNDLGGHISYTRYMIDGWMDPYGYRGHEDFHPLLYYAVAARAYAAAAASPLVNPLTAVRLLSLACYAAFLLAGLRTLGESATKGTPAFYAGTLLIVFWPVNVLMATRINNDVALYAVWGAAFLSLTRWRRTRSGASLAAALCLTGVAFMIKSNAALLAGIAGVCLASALLKGETSVASLFRGKLVWAWSALAAGCLINIGKPILAYAHQGRNLTANYLGGTAAMGLGHFCWFDAASFLREPFVAFEREPSFLNYFLKTMLYGEFTFRHPALASLLNGLLMAQLLVTIVACWRLWRARPHARLSPHVAGVAVPLAGIVLFATLNRSVVAQDFRFVLPLLVPLVILFVRGMEPDGRRGSGAAYWLGLAPSVSLPILGVAFYLAQHLGEAGP